MRELAIVPLLRQRPTPEIATELFHSLGLHGADEHLGRAGRVRSRRLHATYLALAVAFDEEALYLMWLDRGEDAIRIPFSDIDALIYTKLWLGSTGGVFGWPALLGIRWKAISFCVELKPRDSRATEAAVTDPRRPRVASNHAPAQFHRIRPRKRRRG
jgi:hypothetical protein